MIKKSTLFTFLFTSLKAMELDSSSAGSLDSIKPKHYVRSGFFTGGQIGVSLYKASLYDSSGKSVAWGSAVSSEFSVAGREMQPSFNVGLKLGYVHFFSEIIGVRGYFNYDYSDYRTLLSNSKIASEDVSIITDLMLTLKNTNEFSIGIFAGIGIGYNLPQFEHSNVRESIESSYKYNGFIMPFSSGIFAVYNHYKFELAARIPTLQGRYKSTQDSNGFSLNPIIINLSCSYIF